MKAIMISGKPKWTALIMNGKKTDEIRKNKGLYKAIQKLIDEYGYADIYWYCSKNGGNLVYGTEYYGGSFVDEYGITRGYSKQQASVIFGGLLNGKVLFKFRCYKIEEISYDHDEREEWYATKTLNDKELERRSCLMYEELDTYLKGKGYAIRISNLEIFDKPKELSEFRKPNTPSYEQTKPFAEMFGEPYTQEEYKKQCERFGFVLTNAPQNFCYVEVLK